METERTVTFYVDLPALEAELLFQDPTLRPDPERLRRCAFHVAEMLKTYLPKRYGSTVASVSVIVKSDGLGCGLRASGVETTRGFWEAFRLEWRCAQDEALRLFPSRAAIV